MKSISYEGLRHLGATTPYATGDADRADSGLEPLRCVGERLYGGSVPDFECAGILQIDCLAIGAFPPPAFPTFLLYNPYAAAKQVTINIGSNANHLYDAVAGAFLATNVTGSTTLTIPAGYSDCPGAMPGHRRPQPGQPEVAGGWRRHRLLERPPDTDRDGLPDWWESRYYGSITNALPQGAAANGFNNLQCYWLGLDPTNPRSTFQAQAARQPGTGYPLITWNSVGGKSYAVEYAKRPGLVRHGFHARH